MMRKNLTSLFINFLCTAVMSYHKEQVYGESKKVINGHHHSNVLSNYEFLHSPYIAGDTGTEFTVNNRVKNHQLCAKMINLILFGISTMFS